MEHGKQDRLEQLIASYGADPARWPVAERGLYAAVVELEEAQAIDRLLSHASDPLPPVGAVAKLLLRLDDHGPAEVIQFRPKPTPRAGFIRYAAALPLAASLALGIYLGAIGSLDALLPAAVTGDVATTDDTPDDLGGVGEADAYAEENVT